MSRVHCARSRDGFTRATPAPPRHIGVAGSDALRETGVSGKGVQDAPARARQPEAPRAIRGASGQPSIETELGGSPNAITLTLKFSRAHGFTLKSGGTGYPIPTSEGEPRSSQHGAFGGAGAASLPGPSPNPSSVTTPRQLRAHAQNRVSTRTRATWRMLDPGSSPSAKPK